MMDCQFFRGMIRSATLLAWATPIVLSGGCDKGAETTKGGGALASVAADSAATLPALPAEAKRAITKETDDPMTSLGARAVPLPYQQAGSAALVAEPDEPGVTKDVVISVPLAAEKPADAQIYSQNFPDRPTPRVGDKPWIISPEWRARHERQLVAFGRAEAKVVFLGDSIFDGWRMTPAYTKAFGKYRPLDLGIAFDATQHLLWRIEHGALDGLHPEVAVILIGVNNLAGGVSPEQTFTGVRAVVNATLRKLPTTPVVLLGLLPAREKPTAPLRQQITAANRLLAGLAQPGRVTFHDVGAVFLEPDGTIAKAIMDDFLHPTGLGYERLSDVVKPLLLQAAPRLAEVPGDAEVAKAGAEPAGSTPPASVASAPSR